MDNQSFGGGSNFLMVCREGLAGMSDPFLKLLFCWIEDMMIIQNCLLGCLQNNHIKGWIKRR